MITNPSKLNSQLVPIPELHVKYCKQAAIKPANHTKIFRQKQTKKIKKHINKKLAKATTIPKHTRYPIEGNQ